MGPPSPLLSPARPDVQVEVEALDPDDLRRLLTAALAPYWDASAFERSLALEREEAATL